MFDDGRLLVLLGLAGVAAASTVRGSRGVVRSGGRRGPELQALREIGRGVRSVDDASYEGSGEDGGYYAAEYGTFEGVEGWWGTWTIDSDTGGFCDGMRPIGPFDNEEDAREAANDQVSDWCSNNDVETGNEDD
jgi:hypothetical protein